MKLAFWGLQGQGPFRSSVLLTLALARGILESIRLCCSYGKACRNHVIWSPAQTLAGLICQVSGPTCQWPVRVTDS